MKSCLAIAVCSSLILAGCKDGSRSSASLQSRLDQYCAEQAREDQTKVENLTRSDAFFSPKTKTCVKVEVTSGKYWSYDLNDLTHNFMRGPKWIESDQSLNVYHHEYRTFKSAHAEGFWKSTSSDEGKQLVDRIAASIDCDSVEGVCRENDAAIMMNMVHPDSVDYKVSRWDDFGIIADSEDPNECQTSHRLAVAFPTNSVTVTDYPKKSTGSENCKQWRGMPIRIRFMAEASFFTGNMGFLPVMSQGSTTSSWRRWRSSMVTSARRSMTNTWMTRLAASPAQ